MINVKWKYSDGIIKVDVIERVEKLLQIKFPEDYVQCVICNSGANVQPNCFEMGNNQKVFGALLSYDESSVDNILAVYSRIKKFLPKKVIPFACEPSGDYICFDYSKSETEPKIVLWYHDKSVSEDDLDSFDEDVLKNNTLNDLKMDAIYYICDSFTELLNKLY